MKQSAAPGSNFLDLPAITKKIRMLFARSPKAAISTAWRRADSLVQQAGTRTKKTRGKDGASDRADPQLQLSRHIAPLDLPLRWDDADAPPAAKGNSCGDAPTSRAAATDEP
jgi:hypothetical protein